eukprot:gene33302-41096_t
MDDAVVGRSESTASKTDRPSETRAVSVAKPEKKPIKPDPTLDAEEKNFYARHNAEVSFDLATPTDLRYFDLTGKRRPEQINSAGVLIAEEFHDDMKIPAHEMMTDDGLARIERIKTFEETAYRKVVEAEDGFDNYEHALQPGEVILYDFDCTEISDFPATTQHINIYGTTRVSLVKSADDEYRLFFSIKEGMKEIYVEESFYQCGSQPTCLCCCVDLEIPCVDQFRKIKTSQSAEYECNNYLSSQFFTMPVSSLLVDTVCYRSLDNEYSTNHTGVPGEGKKEDCCSCFQYCPDNTLCALKQARNVKSVRFQAYERFHLGGDDVKYNPVVNQPTRDGSWRVTAVNDDVNYIVVHYRSLLDNKNHSCRMRLTRTDDSSGQFQRAQKFVSILGHNRDKKLAAYFAAGGNAGTTRFDAIRSTQPQSPRFIVHANYDNVPPHVLGCATLLSCFVDKRQTVESMMNNIESINNSPLFRMFTNHAGAAAARRGF